MDGKRDTQPAIEAAPSWGSLINPCAVCGLEYDKHCPTRNGPFPFWCSLCSTIHDHKYAELPVLVIDRLRKMESEIETLRAELAGVNRNVDAIPVL